MRKLINSTTILSLALYSVTPFAAQAQDFPKAMIDGKAVICLPDKQAVCPDGALCVIVKNPKNCDAKAAEALAKVTAAIDLGTVVKGTETAADGTVTGTVTLDKSKDASGRDQTAADKAAADQAAADQAAADKAAADKATADQAAADKAAADKAAADKAAADQAAADKAAADQAAADKTATDKAAKKAAKAADAAKAEADVAAAAAAASSFPTVTAGGKVFVCLPDKAAVCPDGASCVIGKTTEKCQEKADAKVAKADPSTTTPAPEPAEDAAAVAAGQKAAARAAAAAAADPNAVTVEAPVPTADAVTTLETALDTPVASDATVTEAPVAARAPEPTAGKLPADEPTPADATVTTEVVKPEDSRASTEEFKPAPATVAPGKKTGLSDFEKVGLIALGALAIGAIINGNRQVVENTGDRVVVRQPDGTYVVYKDDNALLREPGSTVRTETYSDGSTRTIVTRVDGSQIVTIRDASGRVLQRVAYDTTGHPTVLIDDLQPEVAVDVSTLPAPQPSRHQISVDDSDADLRAQLAASDAADLGRKFSLRQIRTIPEVRYLAATIDVNNITFETGSSAIQATEAKKLNRLGNLMTRMIAANPNEVFLVEGHTDAVGSAASNLSLSDRRAESVAKALTEYFDVPPENLVVQGYGESELKVESLGDERANRRVAVRIITPLLRQTAS